MLADINKDFNSTLEIEEEKLRSSIKDHGQELEVKKIHPEQSHDCLGKLLQAEQGSE